MKIENDKSRFTIQDEKEDIPDSIYVADAENLRIEKLSTRITLVAVLIPCLLVIVLAVAYLDIKNRVISTQNTGSIGVQNLSKDLESRFSSLSLKQARLEEQLAAHTATLETSTAAVQVKLKKSIIAFKKDLDGKANRSDLAALAKKNETALGVLKSDVADLNASFETFDEELVDQILRMAKGLEEEQERLAAVEKMAHELETQKLSREAMNLSLGLERLALQELVKDKIREVQKKLVDMDKKIDKLNHQLKIQSNQHATQPQPAPSGSSSTPKPATAKPSASPPPPPAGIEEQTIN